MSKYIKKEKKKRYKNDTFYENIIFISFYSCFFFFVVVLFAKFKVSLCNKISKSRFYGYEKHLITNVDRMNRRKLFSTFFINHIQDFIGVAQFRFIPTK